MAAPSLDLWLYGEHVATVVERRTGKFQLTYTEHALNRWPLGRPLLSVSMPLTPARHPPGVVGPFLDGLLPEGEARTILEGEYGVRRGDVAGLLAEIGQDCAGAVVVVPAGQEPERPRGTAEPISDDELSRLIRLLPERPLGDDRRVRVSLAGQQRKLLLVRADGTWCRPLDGRPSTHILKPADARYPDVAANEVLCLRLARQLGLTDVDAELLDVDGIEVVAVSRYDRERRGRRTRRLHQEDLCQALAVDVGPRGSGKYEDGGGPSFAAVAGVLDVHNGDPEQTGRLVEVATFTVAVGNADAHGKNLSLLLPDRGRITLASLYDIVATVHYERVIATEGVREVSDRLGMHINGKGGINDVTTGDLRAEAAGWHHADDLDERIGGVLDRYTAALGQVASSLPQAPDELVSTLDARGRRLAHGLPPMVPRRG